MSAPFVNTNTLVQTKLWYCRGQKGT